MSKSALAVTAILATSGTVPTTAPQPDQAASPPQTIADLVHYWNGLALGDKVADQVFRTKLVSFT
ncbi:hypothetical protein [Streptomyces yangpuensis]|uniref:hypothetical protein n=1 Tax=Streptomyces yangpuensis TaxID=1648182 RepID=UPI0038010BBA